MDNKLAPLSLRTQNPWLNFYQFILKPILLLPFYCSSSANLISYRLASNSFGGFLEN